MLKRVLIGITLVAATFGAALVTAQPTQALSGSQFKAGNIIDDGIFENSTSMSVQQIQAFLDSKVSCDRNGTKQSELGGGTRAQYGASRGNPAPYTCLPQYYENTSNRENNLSGRGIPNGAISAAQIIYNVAQQFKINPQVLIVMLQKEQGLVTDEWPFPVQFERALGYACPDTAPCDSQYYGFYNQVYNAARQFRLYANNPNSYNHVPRMNNNVRWNPQNWCGTGQVYIENQATASLYNYTPYQPNSAALNNLYGTGDDCSSYGNRNFWRYFNDWFGSTSADAYDYQVVSQDMWQDDTRAKKLDGMWLAPRHDYFVEIKVRNTGSVTWQRGVANKQVNLGTVRGNDRASWFCNKPNWNRECNRATITTESEVKPGDVATFSMWITTPEIIGNYAEYFAPVMDGTSWFRDRGMYFTWRVVPPEWRVAQQQAFTDATKATPIDTTKLVPNQRFYVEFKAENTGTSPWRKGVANHQINIGTSNGRDRRSWFCDGGTWTNCNRAGTAAEAVVDQGQTGTFGFWMRAPDISGTYNEYFNLVMDGTSWAVDPGMYWTLKVNQPTWQPEQQQAFTDSTKATPLDTTKLLPGQRAYVVLKAKNNGPVTWQKGVAGRQPNVGTTRPNDRRSPLCDTGTWGVNCDRAGTMTETSVAPGQTGTFEFWITTPNNPGEYNEYFNLVMDGTSWMNDPGLYWTFKVNQPTPTWDVVSQNVYTNDSKTTGVNTNNLTPNTRYYFEIKAKNTGNVAWQKNVANRKVNIGTARPMDRKSAFCDSGTWNANCDRAGSQSETTVNVGDTGTFGFWVTTPSTPGTYNEYFNLVMDGTSWLNDHGLYWTLKVN